MVSQRLIKLLPFCLSIIVNILPFSHQVAQGKLVLCAQSEWAQQALMLLVQRIGYYPLFYFCYEIKQKAIETVIITFDERDLAHSLNHAIMVECDHDCANVDLQIYDQNNRLIGEDLNINQSFARVRVNNIQNGMRIQVKMTMVNCQTDFCGVVLATAPLGSL